MPDGKLTVATEESWGGSGVSLSAGSIIVHSFLFKFFISPEKSSSLIMHVKVISSERQACCCSIQIVVVANSLIQNDECYIDTVKFHI